MFSVSSVMKEDAMVPSYVNFSDYLHNGPYQSRVAHVLQCLNPHLVHMPPDRVQHDLITVLQSPMTLRQRMYILYTLGILAFHQKEYRPAMRYGQAAYAIARDSEDAGSLVTISNMAGVASHELHWFGQSYTYFQRAQDALNQLGDLSSAWTTYETMECLAIEAFILARYDDARRHVRDARALAHLSGWTHAIVRLDWIEALLYQWKQEPLTALQLILTALQEYEKQAHPVEYSHVQITCADILLDCAESVLDIDKIARWVQQSQSHLHHAFASSVTEGDVVGECQALLVQARALRLAQDGEDGLAIIENVTRRAEALRDAPLLAQAHTARGDMYDAQGNPLTARLFYHKAINALKHSDAQAYLLKPQRAIWAMQEMCL
jgi:tetratricopeptide (TPR) repeat protein